MHTIAQALLMIGSASSLPNSAAIYFGNSPETVVPTQPSQADTFYAADTGLTFQTTSQGSYAYFNNVASGLTPDEKIPVPGGYGIPTSVTNFLSNRNGSSPEMEGLGNLVVISSRQIVSIQFTEYHNCQILDLELLNLAGGVDTLHPGVSAYITAYQTTSITIAPLTATPIYGVRFKPYFLSLATGLLMLSQMTFTFA